MSRYTHIRVGGYDLSDDEDAELTRIQLGGYDHTIVVGGFTEDTASTVEPATRELFAGFTDNHESYEQKTAGDDLVFADANADADTTNDEFNLVNFTQDEAEGEPVNSPTERFTLDAFGV